MKKEELAAEITAQNTINTYLKSQAALHGLVIVYGASDDLMEFDGRIYDEAGAYNGNPIMFDKNGSIEGWESIDKEHEEDVREWIVRRDNCKTITPYWCRGDWTWEYETSIPHATFELIEYDEKYCKGIVFSIDDMEAP